jgi:hypothetical protein
VAVSIWLLPGPFLVQQACRCGQDVARQQQAAARALSKWIRLALGCRSAASASLALAGRIGQAPRSASRRALATRERPMPTREEGRSKSGGRRPMTVPFQRRRRVAGAAAGRKMSRNDLKHGERAAGGGSRVSDRRAWPATTRNGRFGNMQRVRPPHEHDPSPHSEAVPRENTHRRPQPSTCLLTDCLQAAGPLQKTCSESHRQDSGARTVSRSAHHRLTVGFAGPPWRSMSKTVSVSRDGVAPSVECRTSRQRAWTRSASAVSPVCCSDTIRRR